jgi:spore coat protein U-like protein
MKPASRRRRTLVLCGTLALLATAPAHAAVSSCTVTATGVDFGVYDPTVATPTVSTGTISVSCAVTGATGHNPVTVALSAGNSGSFTSRTLVSGTDFLNYNLFIDAAYSQVWGDGTGVSLTNTIFVTPGRQSFTANVYGMMPAAQSSGSGSFNDTITVSVSF